MVLSFENIVKVPLDVFIFTFEIRSQIKRSQETEHCGRSPRQDGFVEAVGEVWIVGVPGGVPVPQLGTAKVRETHFSGSKHFFLSPLRAALSLINCDKIAYSGDKRLKIDDAFGGIF